MVLLLIVTVQHNQFMAGGHALQNLLPMALQSHHSDCGAQMFWEA